MAVISPEAFTEIRSWLDYAMFRTDNVEEIKNALHQISWTFTREVMYKFEEADDAKHIAEIDKAIEKLNKMKLSLQPPNTLSTCEAPPNTGISGSALPNPDVGKTQNFETGTPVGNSPAVAESAGCNVRQNVPKEPETVLEEPENDK